MSKYKVGDKVKIVAPWSDNKGLIGVVGTKASFGESVHVVIDETNEGWYLPDSTELIEPDDMPEDAIELLVSEAFEGPDDSNRRIYTPVTHTPDPKIALHKQITEELTAIYEAKNHDYGDSFQETYRKLGLISAVTRISDKVNRLQSLSKKDQRVDDESIRDTLVDCANYCIMTIIALEETE